MYSETGDQGKRKVPWVSAVLAVFVCAGFAFVFDGSPTAQQPTASVSVSPSSIATAEVTEPQAAAVSADEMEELRDQPTECAHVPYLQKIADNYRDACDAVAKSLQAVVVASGAVCDHVTAVAPAIKDSSVSQVTCVAPGAMFYGRASNLASYLITANGVKRLPEDIQAQQAEREFAVDHALAARQRADDPSLTGR